MPRSTSLMINQRADAGAGGAFTQDRLYRILRSDKRAKMAKARYISDLELDLIRIGIARGHSCIKIAKFMGRSKQVVYNHAEKMRENGTLGDLPLEFVVDEVAAKIEAS